MFFKQYSLMSQLGGVSQLGGAPGITVQPPSALGGPPLTVQNPQSARPTLQNLPIQLIQVENLKLKNSKIIFYM